ncbi:MAG TPA: hypothetical protein VFR33_06165 [Candidatus Dormibacteraeota bacterium]|nr:hypothetical protein [Candidatus Dormibacteraeota bacterium]
MGERVQDDRSWVKVSDRLDFATNKARIDPPSLRSRAIERLVLDLPADDVRPVAITRDRLGDECDDGLRQRRVETDASIAMRARFKVGRDVELRPPDRFHPDGEKNRLPCTARGIENPIELRVSVFADFVPVRGDADET